MTPINWSQGEVIEISGQLYRIHSRSKTGDVNLEHIRDGRFETRLDDELAVLWRHGELARLHDHDGQFKDEHREMLERPYASLPESVKEQAERRMLYMQAYVDSRKRKRSKRVLDPIIARVAAANGDLNPPSARQLSRWLSDWFKIGSPDLRDIRCIAPRFHLRGNRKDRFDPDVEDIVWETIDKFALKPERDSAQDILNEANSCIDSLDLEGRDKRFLDKEGKLRRPSLRTIYRLLNTIDADVLVRTQRGAVEADRTCEPVVRGPQATKPLEEVEMDHTLLDIIVLDADRNVVLGRPWLTVALDRFTRMVVGAHIGFHPPGAHTTMLCLRHAIQPKDELRVDYPNIRNEWPCYGRPKAIVVDNGPEFHSRSLKEACLGLGIDIIYCPVRKPRYKGKVERWFGRLSRQHLHKIPGTTFSNTKQRGDYQSEKQAVMTLTDLRTSIMKWIVDDYSVSVHRGIKDAPVNKWTEAVKRHPVSMPPRVDELNALLSIVEDRALTRKGIEIYGLRYSAKTPEFRALINRADNPARVKVKVDPDNLSFVRVEDWRTKRYFEVPSVDPEYTDGLSLAAHDILCARVKLGLKKYERVTIGALVAARREFRERIQELKRAKKLTSKRLVAAFGEDDEAVKESPALALRAPQKTETSAERLAERTQASTRAHAKHRQPVRPHKPPPVPQPDAEDDDDLAALRARTANSGIVAEVIR